MQRNSFSLLGTLLILVAVCSSSPVSAQQEGATAGVSLPSSCYTKPAGLEAGDYAWDAPACATSRAKWEAARAKAVVAKAIVDTEVLRPSTSASLLSTGSSAPTKQVDKNGLAFVTDGLAQPPTNAQSVWLPKGTLFPVHTMQSYSTFEARPNGKLRFELDQNVIVNGFLVAMKGDTAEGSFPAVMTGRNFFFVAHSGSLFQVTIDTIYNFCGEKIDVDFDRTEYRSGRLGLVGANMDQHIIRGQEYVSFTSRPQRVCGVPTTEGNSPMTSTALYPTTH
jgi:hypothetical protein